MIFVDAKQDIYENLFERRKDKINKINTKQLAIWKTKSEPPTLEWKTDRQEEYLSPYALDFNESNCSYCDEGRRASFEYNWKKIPASVIFKVTDSAETLKN